MPLETDFNHNHQGEHRGNTEWFPKISKSRFPRFHFSVVQMRNSEFLGCRGDWSLPPVWNQMIFFQDRDIFVPELNKRDVSCVRKAFQIIRLPPPRRFFLIWFWKECWSVQSVCLFTNFILTIQAILFMKLFSYFTTLKILILFRNGNILRCQDQISRSTQRSQITFSAIASVLFI